MRCDRWAARFRAGIDQNGLPQALYAEAVGESPTERWFGRQPDKANDAAVEGIARKPYAIPTRRVAQVYLEHPPTLGFGRAFDERLLLRILPR
ncbi:isoquinoline 1-oxidoreductase, beta subunit [Azotobacter beijerinckii]|uniref:Isoquinoline 1-oxidoreductase, beta subunit n=1 Tax=Azotobacter beijerinckii TaxID=170623 RepID=A0A1H6YKD5_9GAMM|nr:isoquinoline 1-oxidoreductase, beta subunit [Azotobacter beijerinckii]SER55095.1 isoquinoline 1-oxidoreductase, beta subunit [Azotobacter beijerinckii]